MDLTENGFSIQYQTSLRSMTKGSHLLAATQLFFRDVCGFFFWHCFSFSFLCSCYNVPLTWSSLRWAGDRVAQTNLPVWAWSRQRAPNMSVQTLKSVLTCIVSAAVRKCVSFLEHEWVGEEKKKWCMGDSLSRLFVHCYDFLPSTDLFCSYDSVSPCGFECGAFCKADQNFHILITNTHSFSEGRKGGTVAWSATCFILLILNSGWATNSYLFVIYLWFVI